MEQQVYLDDTETATLFCLGVMTDDHWEPVRVQGKIAYAYRSEAYAQEICAKHSCLKHTNTILPQEGSQHFSLPKSPLRNASSEMQELPERKKRLLPWGS